jgi:CO/xanthine dehydrogenase Mo-binding subunit
VRQTEVSFGGDGQRPNQELEPWANPTIVGKSLPRVDGYERVSGSAIYTADLLFPDMLHVAILRCPHPHAMVESLNTEELGD